MKPCAGWLVGVLFLGPMSCTKEQHTDAQRGLEVARETKKEATGPVSWIMAQAARERQTHDEQLARLNRILAEVERLVADNKLDEAEVKAVSISWVPVTSAENSTDKLLVSQFDEKRRALTEIIQRRRTPHGR